MFEIGTIIGQYEIVCHIGSGGMGSVYRARHITLGNDVAIKVLASNYTTNERVRFRFGQEAHVQSRLKHPNIVPVHDLLTEGNSLAIVMDLVEGPVLEQVTHDERNGPWKLEDARAIMDPLVGALAYAHERGIAHRDIKPGNIILDRSMPTNDLGVPKLTDFGLAKILASEEGITRTGARMGTMGYMAPEQFEGSKDVGPAADVFALGMLYWRLLVGDLPYNPEDMRELLSFYTGQKTIPSPRTVESGIPSALSRVILEALILDPNVRPKDAGAWEKMLAEAYDAPEPTRDEDTLDESIEANELPAFTYVPPEVPTRQSERQPQLIAEATEERIWVPQAATAAKLFAIAATLQLIVLLGWHLAPDSMMKILSYSHDASQLQMFLRRAVNVLLPAQGLGFLLVFAILRLARSVSGPATVLNPSLAKTLIVLFVLSYTQFAIQFCLVFEMYEALSSVPIWLIKTIHYGYWLSVLCLVFILGHSGGQLQQFANLLMIALSFFLFATFTESPDLMKLSYFGILGGFIMLAKAIVMTDGKLWRNAESSNQTSSFFSSIFTVRDSGSSAGLHGHEPEEWELHPDRRFPNFVLVIVVVVILFLLLHFSNSA